MLVLSRRIGQIIVIGNSTILTVLRIQDGRLLLKVELSTSFGSQYDANQNPQFTVTRTNGPPESCEFLMKLGERIVIEGEGIEIVFSYLRSKRAGIAISAPMEIPVHRLEVLERIRAERG